jgi:hypothetical protein
VSATQMMPSVHNGAPSAGRITVIHAEVTSRTQLRRYRHKVCALGGLYMKAILMLGSSNEMQLAWFLCYTCV